MRLISLDYSLVCGYYGILAKSISASFALLAMFYANFSEIYPFPATDLIRNVSLISAN